MRPAPMRTAPTRLVALAAAGAGVFLYGGVAHAATTSVSYNANAIFTDSVGSYFADGSGMGHRGYIKQGSPAGTISLVPHGTGKAAKFPAGCMTEGCRVIIEAADAADLDPGSGSITWGADVLLQPGEVTAGANVLQKGFAGGTSGLYKVQADGGRAGCAMVATGGTTIYRAGWATSIADGKWHTLRCTRTSGTLTLTVDGVVRETNSNLPPTLSVSNSVPLRLGGKNTSATNDQFFGAIDNAFVQLG